MCKDNILRDYDEILEVLTEFFRDQEKATLWMLVKNPLLGNVSPSYMISVGRADKLRKFVFNAIEENRRTGNAA